MELSTGKRSRYFRHLFEILQTDARLQLLQWFLHDGAIRGVTPEGQVFEHAADNPLARAFARRIMEINIQGV